MIEKIVDYFLMQSPVVFVCVLGMLLAGMALTFGMYTLYCLQKPARKR